MALPQRCLLKEVLAQEKVILPLLSSLQLLLTSSIYACCCSQSICTWRGQWHRWRTKHNINQPVRGQTRKIAFIPDGAQQHEGTRGQGQHHQDALGILLAGDCKHQHQQQERLGIRLDDSRERREDDNGEVQKGGTPNGAQQKAVGSFAQLQQVSEKSSWL